MNPRPRDADRPSPDALLREAAREGRGRLKVFLGAAPGVGKTWEMLSDGFARRKAGTDVVVGIDVRGEVELDAVHDVADEIEIALDQVLLVDGAGGDALIGAPDGGRGKRGGFGGGNDGRGSGGIHG